MDTLYFEGHQVVREGGPPHRLGSKVVSFPLFRTVRGRDGEWDAPDTLLMADNTLKLEYEIFFTIRVGTSVNLWTAELFAVAPEAPDKALIRAALDYSGNYMDDVPLSDRTWVTVEALLTYGAAATLGKFYSDAPRSAVLAAKVEAAGAFDNFDNYMKAPTNKLGMSGWDFITGLVPAEKPARLK